MQKFFSKLLNHEGFAYLFFGLLAMLISIGSRLALNFFFGLSAGLSTNIGNIIAILFAFVTNDRYVFKQKPEGWPKRLVSFMLSRLFTFILEWAISTFFVDKHPEIIGQFVNHNKGTVFLIVTIFSQGLIIVLNYVLSKLFVFKDKKKQNSWAHSGVLFTG